MGWSSANDIFNPVARALIDANAPDDTKRKVLGNLIGGLQDGDWDTEDESLEDFLDEPAIVAAFHDKDVHLSDRRCCRAVHAKDPRAHLLAMRHEDVSEEEMAAAIDAYAHRLANQIRLQVDAVRGSTAPAVQLANWAANLIDPKAQS